MQTNMAKRMPYENELDRLRLEYEAKVNDIRALMAKDPEVIADKRGDVKIRDWAKQNKYIITSFSEGFHAFQPWRGFPILLQKAPDYIFHRDGYRCELMELKEAHGPNSINIREDAIEPYKMWNCFFETCRFFFYDWETKRYCINQFQTIFDLIDNHSFPRHTYKDDGHTVIQIPKTFLEWHEGL